ncbi:LisH domain-containing protein [Ceratocystis fimbriata CBS 114723]|uniref:LisH domain-containing protein n=1 Tax=Ceratocystis fimbriata CBS 114723 TaxID=1035309 RepID=A0A2C5WX53_9PEZI|nr:LisH domain-containing protein [Ceratocystis fimbriata CBS 114723]
MKKSFIILAGASTVSAGWIHKFICCGGFSDGPQTATTVASTFGAGTPAPTTTTSLDMEKIYPTSPDYREPTTLLTSVVPVKTADVESVPMDQDLDLESGYVGSISADQDLDLEGADVESSSTDEDLELESGDVESSSEDQDPELKSGHVESISADQGPELESADVESISTDQGPELESGDVESISADQDLDLEGADVESSSTDQDLELESGDVESISEDQDPELESGHVESISADQDLNLESADVEPIPMGQGLIEADPTTDAGIAISPTEVSKSDYPESAGTPSLEKVDSILKDASSTESEEEARAIQEAEDLAMDAGPKELVQLIDSFQEKAIAIEEMIESRDQATNQVPGDSEVGSETSDETIDSLVSRLAITDVMTAVLMIRFSELNKLKVPSQKAIEDDEKDMFFSFTAEDDFSIDEEPGSNLLVEIGKPSSSKLEFIDSDKVSGDKISGDKISGDRISGLVEIIRNQRMMGKQQLPVSEGEEDGVKYPATTETTTNSLKLGQEDSDGSSGRKQNPTSGVDSLD